MFKPSLLEMDTSHRERWRDEERDTNSSVRKDRWRDGEKEFSETRRVDRWADNLSNRRYGEARRAPSERWSDSSHRDSNYEQRRESKWNTRWGPDDKETEVIRDKWTDSGRDKELPADKGLPHPNQAKDEKEGDHYRPWRPSSMQGRGREPAHNQSPIPNKQSTFSYGRGRGENASIFSLGRGRYNPGGSAINNNSGYSQTVGNVPEKLDIGHGESSPFRYSRTKLIDIYRITDLKSYQKVIEELQVPTLTQEDPLEPLALCTPNTDEMVTLVNN